MTTSKTIDNYGGIFSDAKAVEDPSVEMSAGYHNRLAEDTAQMTRTTVKAWVKVTTVAINGSAPIVAGSSHMGTGSGSLPTAVRTATGRLTITYPATWTDPLGVVETLAFQFALGTVPDLGVDARINCTASANAVLVAVRDAAGADSDLGASTPILIVIF